MYGSPSIGDSRYPTILQTMCAKGFGQVLWLNTPSFQNNPHRALDLYKTTLSIANNGHDLAWNASIARIAPHGPAMCSGFSLGQPHNVKRQPCQGAKKRRDLTPPKWVSPRMYRDDVSTALQRVINAGDVSGRILSRLGLINGLQPSATFASSPSDGSLRLTRLDRSCSS